MTATVTDQASTTFNGVPDTSAAIVRAPATTGSEADRAISVFSSEDAYKASLRMANALSQSSLVPAAYQGQANIPNVLIAMELASRIGASVLMVMQSLDVIHGRPSWRAQFLIATTNACGRFTPLRFRWYGTEGKNDWGCRAYAKDRENGEECVGAKITMQMALDEKWATKPGTKWATMPEQMLMYRAAAFWTRVYAPELSLGIQTHEEAEDIFAAGRSLPVASSDIRQLEAELRAQSVPATLVTDKPPAPVASPSPTLPQAPVKADADGVVTESLPAWADPAKTPVDPRSTDTKPLRTKRRGPDAEQDGEPPETVGRQPGDD
jgi:hypothetical protein